MSPRLVSFAKTLLVFVLLGPPIGALTFMGLLALAGVFNTEGGNPTDVVWVILFALIYAVPLSYLIGALPAAVVGALIGAAQIWRGPLTWWMALAIGLLAGFWLYGSGGGPLPTPGSDTAERGPQSLRLVVQVATCLVPTMLCWVLTRRHQAKGPAPPA